ncbi:MAG: hypothetical protein KGL39_59015 [Patescibacteria group bacterium]|nr:hypothetical protein [Patescibacteria group bacterium]
MQTTSFPDSPEACALVLFAMVLALEPERRNEPARRWALDLFADCLRAVRGERGQGEGLVGLH